MSDQSRFGLYVIFNFVPVAATLLALLTWQFSVIYDTSLFAASELGLRDYVDWRSIGNNNPRQVFVFWVVMAIGLPLNIATCAYSGIKTGAFAHAASAHKRNVITKKGRSKAIAKDYLDLIGGVLIGVLCIATVWMIPGDSSRCIGCETDSFFGFILINAVGHQLCLWLALLCIAVIIKHSTMPRDKPST